MSHSPFDQFKINDLVSMHVGSYDLSFTNASLFMFFAVLLILSYFYFSIKYSKLIPGKLQNSAEIIYNFVFSTVEENVGDDAKKYFPFIFSVFIFILFCNLLGMIPYSFSVTSHIAVTFTLAIAVFTLVTIVGFVKNGMKFFNLFLPAGTPIWMAPIMVIIELFSYLSRPISLSVRLAANMMAGHVLLKVIAGFVVPMGLLLGLIPISFLMVITGFEIFAAILQAYIFTILSCVYLNNALHLH